MFQGVLLGLVVMAAVDGFEPVKAKAVQVESVSKLLEAFGKQCEPTDPIEEKECAKKTAEVRAPYKNKQLYINLGGGFENLMEPLEAGPNRGGVLLTPVIDVGAGAALTFSKPKSLDKGGNIVVPRVPLEGAFLDDEMTAGDLRRLVKTGQVSLEVVCTVKGPWELKRKEGDPVKGLEVQVVGMRLSNRRTGKPLVSQVK